MSDAYGVFRQVDGYTERAIFIIDKEGVIQYIDVHDIDQQPDNEVLRNVIREVDPHAAQVFTPFEQEEEEVPNGGVVLYCTNWCKDCRLARAWLNEHEIDYIEVDVDYNQAARDRVRRWGKGALITPTFDVDGTIVLDYDEARLEEIFKNYAK